MRAVCGSWIRQQGASVRTTHRPLFTALASTRPALFRAVAVHHHHAHSLTASRSLYSAVQRVIPDTSPPHHEEALTMRAAAPPTAPFPTNGLLPKETTQALQFLKKYPEYDGRGVRVAILDTGVDVAAIGLDGAGKMVDAIDCTGSGDIALSETKPEATSSIKDAISLKSSLTGRTLLLSSSLKNPTGTWWTGAQEAYKLWPRDLIQRRKKERKRAFDVEQARLVDEVQQKLFALESSNNGKSEKKEGTDEKEKTTDSETPVGRQKEDLKAQLAVLKELDQSYSDIGPIIEVVVFHDGTHYRTLVGGAEGDVHDEALGLPAAQLEPLNNATVDLTASPALTDFRFERKHGEFGAVDMLTYTTNVLTDDKDVEQAMKNPKGKPVALSLVVNSGSHATHVAGIVGAYRTDDEVKNGVSPGCELVSLKIGDSRLGSMETQQALLRASQALIATECDIANMSFGESGAFGAENKGAFAEMLRDFVVRRRDILFISSAGNNGPALTTVGMPGGTTTSILSIGAYVDAGAMQEAEYALVERNVPSSATTWCSRGPTADGAKGVDVYAPGAAITSIPRYCLQATMMANGTSMSSPNACGSIALLLSAMKKERIPISAARVYKAVRATGKDVGDDLATPFIQVDKAWDYLVEHKDLPDQDAEFRVAVTPAGKTPGKHGTDVRGIYLRDPPFTHRVNQYQVTVKPTFRDFGKEEQTYDLQLPVSLVATEPWIQTPEYVFLGGNGRTFEVRVDPTKLEPGLHTAFVQGYDSDRPGRLLFDIPVTVTKPIVSDNPTVSLHKLSLSKGKVDRHFVAVPHGATWADVKFRSSAHEVSGTAARLWAHFLQLEAQRRLPDVESASVLSLQENEVVSKRVKVKGGLTMEVCLAQIFTSASAFNLDVDIEFHGVSVSRLVGGRDELTIIGGEGIAKLECQSTLRVETFKPSISFDRRRTFLRPQSSSIQPLITARDLLPDGKYNSELLLTYNFELKEERSDVTLSLPLSNALYDSAVPMLLQVFDINKKRVAFGDVYPKPLEKLARGSYTVKVQLLHSALAVLESHRHMTLRVDQKLTKPVESVQLYEDHVDQFGAAKANGIKEGTIKLLPGERKILCLNTNLEGDQIPKEASPGDLLLGTVSFCAPNDKSPLRYLVPPPVRKEKNGDDDAEPPKVVELLTGLVSKVPEGEKKEFVEKLLKEYPDDLGVLVAKLDSLKPDEGDEATAALQAADAVLQHKSVNEEEILIYMGSKKLPPSELTKDDKAKNKRLDKAKSALLLALNRKSRALLVQGSGQGSAAFEETFARYRRLTDANSDKEFANVYVTWSTLHNYHGQALQAARKAIKDAGAGTSATNKDKLKAEELQRTLFAKLGWRLWSAVADRQRVLQAPKEFEQF